MSGIMEADDGPKQTKIDPVYLMVLDDDDDNDNDDASMKCEDADSSAVTVTERPSNKTPQTIETPTTTETSRATETPPPVTPRPIETLVPETSRATETPPPVAPRPIETLPLAARPRPNKSDSSEGEGTHYEEIPNDGPEYEYIPFDRRGENDEIERDRIEVKIEKDGSRIRSGIPLPSIPTQPPPVTAMKAVSSRRRLPVRRRTVILTSTSIIIAITVANIIAGVLIFSKGKDIKTLL